MLKPVEVSLSLDYLDRSNHMVYDGVLLPVWLMSYLRRNKIPHHVEYTDIGKRLIISFKSRHQANIWKYKGNERYPFFEFL